MAAGRPLVLSSADCTSCSTTPRSLSSENCRVMTETPAPLLEDICLSPEIWPRLRSSGAVIIRAIVSGPAPGR